MGGFMEWATSSLSMKRRKPEQQTVDELESATKELDRSCKRFEEARMCQENIARLLRQQLATLRRHIANTTDEEVKTALIEQERLLRDMYEQAKRELKGLDVKRARARRECHASRLKLNDLIVDLADEKRRKRGSFGEKRRELSSERNAGDWMTHTL